MAVYRDWLRTLRPASYRGARFFVEHDSIETGRRLVVHEFPHAEQPYIEDLGRDANRIEVTAYVLGDAADRSEAALRSACETKGAAELALPIARMRARCDKCRREFKKDKLGYVAFTLSFVRDGGGDLPLPAVFLGQLAQWAGAAIATPLAAAFATVFQTIGTAGFVRDAALGQIQAVAGTLDVVARAMPLAPASAPAILRSIADLYAAAPDLIAAGQRVDVTTRTSFVAGDAQPIASAYVASVVDIVQRLRQSVTPSIAREALAPLASYLPPTLPRATPSERTLASNAIAVADVIRVSAATEIAIAAAIARYDDRPSAIAARAEVAELVEQVVVSLDGPHTRTVAATLSDLGGRVAEAITARVADLAPVQTIESNATLPCLWWSWRLYATADRGGELVRRNGIKHGGFMPRSFEALAR